uniref:Uncharacterized protein n=1 Tax=Macaca nemestrina TaxID=9545 RepID=A0A2K6BHR6_MACNE
MPEAHMQPANITAHHRPQKQEACFLLLNSQNCYFAAATLELSIISDTHFCKPITKDQLSSRSELNTLRLKHLNSFRGWKILTQISLT